MILAKFKEFVKILPSWAKSNMDTLALVIIGILFILLSFACGYAIAKYQDREPIVIENNQ